MQLAITLPDQLINGQDNLILSPANIDVWRWLSAWPKWPLPQVVVTGSVGCGKTHMAQSLPGFHITIETYHQYDPMILVQNQSLLIIDDFDQFEDETWLFHLYNLIKEHDRQAVYFSHQTPAVHQFKIADLASRLRSLPCLTIHEPDDELFRQLFKKQLYAKGIVCSEDILEYVFRRFDRSYQTIHWLVKLINDQTLLQQRPLTVPFLKDILGE